ncbi:Aste57867_18684 [Aphanomyces stellatus]|uniref:Aste57867_18684 protein n=1 Tax=Aphanomyces stellatus TaxID=120398 RepID=A0A485LBM0_9STRA|nr:hypothetical protein As57867_018622 [Aphanomyces stellatus]VFT95419.1 Aste57867_18684 [Aphanomyces stellatus]
MAAETNKERLLLHMEGDALTEEEDEMLMNFTLAKRALGHMVDRRHPSVDAPAPTRILWVVKAACDTSPSSLDVRAAFNNLQHQCVYIDLVFLHDAKHSQDIFDQLQGLPWHGSAYVFETTCNDQPRLAKILATLLAVPAHRIDQDSAETLMGLHDDVVH